MKIAIIGAGAMGSMTGARLAAAGNDVTAIDVWREHVDKINLYGLTMQIRGQDAKAWPLRAVTRYEDVQGQVDLAIVFVKGTFTREAIAAASNCFIGPSTYVLTIQNGVGNAESIAEFVAPDHIVVGVTTCSATLVEPGVVNDTSERIPNQCGTHIASFSKRNNYRIHEIAAVLSNAGIATDVSENVEVLIWTKLAVNCAVNGPCVLTRVDMGTLAGNDYGHRLHDQIVNELVEVCHAKGIAVDKQLVRANVAALCKGSSHHPSMAQDAFRKKMTEIDTISGAVVRGGCETGIPTPVNETIYNLVHIVQNSYDKRWY